MASLPTRYVQLHRNTTGDTSLHLQYCGVGGCAPIQLPIRFYTCTNFAIYSFFMVVSLASLGSGYVLAQFFPHRRDTNFYWRMIQEVVPMAWFFYTAIKAVDRGQCLEQILLVLNDGQLPLASPDGSPTMSAAEAEQVIAAKLSRAIWKISTTYLPSIQFNILLRGSQEWIMEWGRDRAERKQTVDEESRESERDQGADLERRTW